MARLYSSIEPLETRIAPAAVAAINPLPDIVAGLGKTGSVIDLGNLYDSTPSGYHTMVEFLTNFDTDTITPGLQAGKITLELYDDVTPLTVQNFLSYVNNAVAKGDYNGVFFHRAAKTATEGLDILQAGGFEATTPGTHITTGPNVLNEYSVANTEGTIAMAKSVGANSGSSEFFFNMGDNSTTLGPGNNGGFTVFGKVTAGYDVLTKIFNSPIVDESAATKNGALSTVPYQGTYNSNPDQNLVTPPPALAASNYITITSAKVVAPADAVSPNIRYDIVSVYDHGTTKANVIKTATITAGDKLSLVYNSSTTGVADVVIRATDTVTKEILGTDTFSVTLKPDLVVSAFGENLQPVIGPGDAATGQVAITNAGGGLLAGKVTVSYYLSKITEAANLGGTDETGGLFDASDVLLKTSAAKTISLTTGKTAILASDTVNIPTALVSEQTSYRIIAVVNTTPDALGKNFSEYSTDNNYAASGGVHTITNTFGNLVVNNTLVRSHPSITYTDVDGKVVTATLTGPGLGQLTPAFDSSNHLTGVSLDLFDTTIASNLAVRTATTATHTTLDNLRVNLDSGNEVVPFGTITAPNVDLTGIFVAPGGLKGVTLGDILRTTDPTNSSQTLAHLFVLGSSAPLAKLQATIKLGKVDNTLFTSALPVASMTVISWKNDVINETSTFAGLKSLTTTGLAKNPNISGDNGDTGNLQAALYVSAIYGDSTYMNVASASTVPMTTFKVAGVLKQSNVNIDANITTVDVGAIDRTEFIAGADSVVSDVSQFNNIRTIANFIVRGGVAGQSSSMIDSDIVAADFTSIKIAGAIETPLGFDEWGFIADKIGTYSRAAYGTGADARAAVSLKNLTAPNLYDAKDNFAVRMV